MAGSLRNFQYTDDSGQIWLFKGDESNVEGVNVAAANIAAANASRPGIPRNIKPRRVFYTNSDRTRTLGVIASTVAIYNTPPNTIPDGVAGTGTLTLARKTPERVKLYPNIDTGLLDGDNP
jgi:hypothetical protein